MIQMNELMEAEKFKTHCLKVIDQVQCKGKRIVITKGNVPIAQIVPIDEEASLFGKMKGTIHFSDNIIDPE